MHTFLLHESIYYVPRTELSRSHRTYAVDIFTVAREK